jgi:hypothetical protein
MKPVIEISIYQITEDYFDMNIVSDYPIGIVRRIAFELINNLYSREHKKISEN